MSGIKRRWVRNYILIILLIAIAVMGIFLFTIQRFYYNLAYENLYNRMNVSAGFYTKYTETDKLSLDEIAQLILRDYQDRDVAELQILSPEGIVLYSSTGFASNNRIASKDFVDATYGFQGNWVGKNDMTHERVMGVSTPLKDDHGNVIGVLRYVSSMQQIDLLLYRFFLYSALILTGIIIVLLILSVTFSRSILTPINEITLASRKMAEGNFDEKVPVIYKDELGVLAQTLNSMADDIQKTEKLKNEFISSISHEIRTPLTAVAGWAETILTGDLSDRDEVEKGLQVIMRETGRLSDMVEELLDFSRIESGRMTLHNELFDLRRELSDIVEIYRAKADKHGVAISMTQTEEPTLVTGDTNRIRQVIINIIDNAVKFSGENDVIDIRLGMDEWIVLDVQDHGAGISEEDLENVTKKFYKGSSKRSGSGLGLAISDEIVRLHGGELRIKSKLDEGTTIQVVLPKGKAEDLEPQEVF